MMAPPAATQAVPLRNFWMNASSSGVTGVNASSVRKRQFWQVWVHGATAGARAAVIGWGMAKNRGLMDAVWAMSFHIATKSRDSYIVRSMHTSSSLYEVLYVSTIAPDAPVSVVAGIAAKARISNQQRGITGLLIFDGQRFCQQLEGTQKQVLSLVERIRLDPRHIDVNVVHHGPLAVRRFKQFDLGYASVDDEDALAVLEQLDGQAAIEAFTAMLSAVDL